LIDTQSAQHASGRSAAVKQVAGGCFCCRADELVAKIKELDEAVRPEIFIAEPVGSCTDLMATVVLPLQKVYQLPIAISPLSVLLDAERLWRHYFGERRSGEKMKRDFSEEVKYIYLKQMEEAEVLVIHKCDRLSEDKRDLLHETVKKISRQESIDGVITYG
jgi:G3E family GTPase